MTLRAEEMDKGYWWRAVYDSTNEIIDDPDNHFPKRYKKGIEARKVAGYTAEDTYVRNGN